MNNFETSGSNSACVVANKPEVEDQLEKLRACVGRLQNDIESLQTRLLPVTSPDKVEEMKEMTPDLCPLALEIAKCNGSLEIIRSNVISILNRLQL